MKNRTFPANVSRAITTTTTTAEAYRAVVIVNLHDGSILFIKF
jgi:hypothetical protein